MRIRFLVVAGLLMALAAPAFAADAAKTDIKGLYLLTDYPAVTVRPGTTSTVNLRLRNYGLPPERLALSVSGVPQGWTATLLGGGQPVAAAMPATNDSVALRTAARRAGKDAAIGTQTLTVTAKGQRDQVTLPVAVTLAKDLPAKLTIKPQLPSAARHLEVELRVSAHDQERQRHAISLVSLAAQAPQNFETSFTEQYGSQELTVDPGRCRPVQGRQAQGAAAEHGRRRPLSGVGARSPPRTPTPTPRSRSRSPASRKLDIAGRDGLLSARAEAGKEASIPIVGHQHRHRAGRRDRALRHRAERLEDQLRAEDHRPHRARPEQGSAGADHAAREGDRRRLRADVRASARGETGSAQFRVTVTTSTMWGIAGVGIIGVALLIMVGAVARFGRR